MSSSSGSRSRARMCWLVLDLMHAGMSLSIVDRAFLLPRSREEAWSTATQYFFLLQFVQFVTVAGRRYLVLAVWIGDSGHVCVGKQQVECDRQEGQVSHQGEVLAVQNFSVQPVREGEPVQSLADVLKVWISHAHGQVIIIQPLRDKQAKDGRVRKAFYRKTATEQARYLGHLFILSTR